MTVSVLSMFINTLRYLLVAAARLMLGIVHGANLGLGGFFEI